MDAPLIISQVKERLPRRVYFLMANEVAERFSFYGMTAILPTYLRDQFFGLRVIAGIALIGFSALSQFSGEFFRTRLRGLRYVGKGNFSAFGCETAHQRFSNSARPACDKGDFSC